MTTVNEIAKDLKRLIDDAVASATCNDETYKEKFERLKWEILETKERAIALHADMQQNGLTVGTIEAEGYLRCAITIANLIED